MSSGDNLGLALAAVDLVQDPANPALFDLPAATAILDRFLHNAEVIAITGKSYRLRKRSPKEQPPAETTACGDEKK